MTRQRLRIFVSSPGDVTAAREVAAQIVDKLAHEFARFFAIEPYLWEYEPMLASGHFQDSIDPPSKFDAVILILESRLGTSLPERTAVREYRGIDGRAPVTGTEWEFENALAGAREHGVPDLLVYRSRRPAEVSTWDAHSRQAAFAQIEALDSFWSRHFANRGSFIGGYAEFQTLESLASRLESDLRRCVQRRLEALAPGDRAASALWPGNPFRGLEVYELAHASIFFGREEAVGAALLRLVTNAQAGRPFLLVLGASGSGKSSLVKSGVLPRLLVPQRVTGSAFLRRTVFRPGDAQADEDLFDALARRLTTVDAEGTGLPEILGSSMSVKDLARHLRESAAHPDMPFAMVLDRLAEAARAEGTMLRYERPAMILEVDQLEELFTSERIQPAERRSFVRLLAALVSSRLIWVIATMRADFWHRALEIPELVEWADRGRLDLPVPATSELSQVIRGPAEAAATSFETHPANGIPLNDLIAQEAAGAPGALPLLSYLLDQLYKRDIQDAGGEALTYASYNALGGLKGAIATRADAVIAAQPPEVQQALQSVLFAMIQMSAGDGDVDRAVARRAPLSDFPAGTPKRRLIEALLDPSARLLVAESTGGQRATVRLAHEALISEWASARNHVVGNAEALKARRMLEDRYARWQAISTEGSGAARRASTLFGSVRVRLGPARGLLTDVDLVDARRLLQHHIEELSPELVGYIERSIAEYRRRRQRAFRIATAAAVVLGVLAIGASYEATVASSQREAALLAQRRSLTQTAAARLNTGDVAGASGIILGVLANGSGTRGVSADTLSVFQEARAADVQVLALTGHASWVVSAAYSLDGQRIVTGSNDGTARVWDAATGEQLLVLSGHTALVRSAAFSPDGRRVATASFDKTVRVWDATSGQQLHLLSGHTAKVTSASFSPDGRRIVTASGDKTARIWDANSGEPLRVLSGHTDGVQTAVFSADGQRIVTASNDRTARVWDSVRGGQRLLLTGHTGEVASAAFSPDGQLIVTASTDKTARIWDATTGEQVRVLSGHTDVVQSAEFSPDGRRIVTASYDKTARVWDTTSGAQELVLSGHTEQLVIAAFSPDGSRIVTGSSDRTARIWDATNPANLLVLRGHTGTVGGAVFSRDERRIVTASNDKTAVVWDATSGQQLLALRGHRGWVASAVYSPDGQRIATASGDGTARIWDATSSRQLLALNGHTDAVQSVAFSPDGQRIVTASSDRTARVWDATSGRQLIVLSGHKDILETAAFSSDARRIVTASNDKTARVWDSASSRQLLVLSGHAGIVQSAAFSPDDQRILTASTDRTAKVWDATSGRQLLVLSGHTAALEGATFSRDGRYIVTASDDTTTRIWDATSGQQLHVLSGHTGIVQSAAFSADGQRIVTGSADNTARVWDARAPALDAQLRWAAAAQFDPLWNPERFQLGLPLASDVRRWPAEASQCDQAAGAPFDPLRRASGVMLGDIVPDIAAAACTQGEDRSGSSPRSLYEHGRTLVARADFTDAKREFEQALRDGYAAAGIDLGTLLTQPSTGMLDIPKAIALYEKAWKDHVPIAAFELGTLYEHGVRKRDLQYVLAPDEARAWSWYQKGADSGEPNALAHFGEREDRAVLGPQSARERSAHLLRAFRYYASASEGARLEDWPDSAWRDWRYRRASIARLLAHDGIMEEVAREYDAVRARYTPHRTAWQRVASLVGFE